VTRIRDALHLEGRTLVGATQAPACGGSLPRACAGSERSVSDGAAPSVSVTTADSQTLVDGEATANTVYGLSPEDWSHAALSVVVVGASGAVLCPQRPATHALLHTRPGRAALLPPGCQAQHERVLARVLMWRGSSC